MNKQVRRELEVAFSKHAQPVWFRIVKYMVLGLTCFFFWDAEGFWIVVLVLFIIAMALHFWYRHKTSGWTKSYGMWDYEKNRSKLE